MHTAVSAVQTLEKKKKEKKKEWQLRMTKISWHVVQINLYKATCACFSNGNATS